MKTVSFRADDELLSFLETESEKRHLPISTTAQVLLVEYAEELGALGSAGDDNSENEPANSEDDDVGECSDSSGRLEALGELPEDLPSEVLEALRNNESQIIVREGHSDKYGYRLPGDSNMKNAGGVRYVAKIRTLGENLYRFYEHEPPYKDKMEIQDELY